MNKGQKIAVTLELADQLLQNGSWCGETHIQKAMFLLQTLLNAGTDFDFVLYKHGPFSFDLRDSLLEATADGLIENVLRQPSYGPTLAVTADGREFLHRFPKTLERHSALIEFLSARLGSKGVSELERLATAVYLNERSVGSNEAKAEQLVRIKPHISMPDARNAFREADELTAEAMMVTGDFD